MKKLILSSAYTLLMIFLVSCGGSNKEGYNSDTTQTQKVESSNDKSNKEENKTPKTPNALTDKTFAYGINMKDCDGSTFSEYGIDLKFSADNTVEQIMTSVGDMGSENAFAIKATSKGTYTIENEVLTIDFTEAKEEHIRNEKAFKTETIKPIDLSLKISKCKDGRLQLVSNSEDTDVLGKKKESNDKSSWSLKK